MDTTPAEKSPEDSTLCAKILDVDSAIRSAVVVRGDQVSGFASSAKATNVLSQTEFRDKIGFWVRIVTEISRQTEPIFGNTDSISFVHERLKLVTFPISANRSIGLSLERSADANYLVQKVKANLGPTF